MTKHAGKAFRDGLRIMFWSLVLLLALFAAGALAIVVSQWIVAIREHLLLIASVLLGMWVLFALFTLRFFRDPTPLELAIPNAIVSPAAGKVDVIDRTTETEFMQGPCQRISVFLSIFDVHVQRAPVSGTLLYMKHKPGKFMSATKTHSAEHNENVLMGFDVKEYPGQKIAVRLIAGLVARRIVTWAEVDDELKRSERLSLIRYGSRCEIYLPPEVKVQVKLGDKVKAGETIVASFE